MSKNKQENETRKRRAFTIVEMVIVIAVIAILAAVLIPTFSNVVQSARISKDIALVKNMNTIVAITESATASSELNQDETAQAIQLSETDDEALSISLLSGTDSNTVQTASLSTNETAQIILLSDDGDSTTESEDTGISYTENFTNNLEALEENGIPYSSIVATAKNHYIVYDAAYNRFGLVEVYTSGVYDEFIKEWAYAENDQHTDTTLPAEDEFNSGTYRCDGIWFLVQDLEEDKLTISGNAYTWCDENTVMPKATVEMVTEEDGIANLVFNGDGTATATGTKKFGSWLKDDTCTLDETAIYYLGCEETSDSIKESSFQDWNCDWVVTIDMEVEDGFSLSRAGKFTLTDTIATQCGYTSAQAMAKDMNGLLEDMGYTIKEGDEIEYIWKYDLTLAGNYGSYGWISLLDAMGLADYTPIPISINGEQVEYRLLKLMGVTMTYYEVYLFVGNFICGAYYTGDESGTMTVELKLYETYKAAGISDTTLSETGTVLTAGRFIYYINQ